MKKTKIQLAIILTLTVALIALIFATIAQGRQTATFPSGAEADKPEIGQTPTVEHSLTRAARLSLGDCDVENNYGGSGEETLIAAIGYLGRIYVFTNTTSADLDFSGCDGAAMLVLDDELFVKGVHPLGGKIEAATLGEGGFVVASEVDGAVVLSLVSPNGFVAKSLQLGEIGNVKSLYLTADGYALITERENGALSKPALGVHALDFALNLVYERVVTSGYSLSFVAAYTIGEKTHVFFNASSDLGTHIGETICTAATEPSTRYLSRFDDSTASAVTPTSSGWLIGKADGVTLVGRDLAAVKTIETSPLPSLRYAGGLYYAFGNGSAVAFDSELSRSRSLDYFNGVTTVDDCVSCDEYGVFSCSTDYGVCVIASENRLNLRLRGKLSGARLVKLGGKLYVIAESGGESGDVGGSFGGKDLWAARLKIE